MADQIYTTQANSGVSQDFDGGWHTLGPEFRLSSAGVLVGGRARYPSTDPVNFAWAVIRLSDQAIVAQVNLAALFGTGAVNNAWNSFTSAQFDTPGDVALQAYPAESYIVATATNGDFLYRNTGVSYPVSSGGIVSGVSARFINSGTGLTFPAGTNTTDYLFADVEVVEDNGGQLEAEAASTLSVAVMAVGSAGVSSGSTVAVSVSIAAAGQVGMVASASLALTSTGTASSSAVATAGVSIGVATTVGHSLGVSAAAEMLLSAAVTPVASVGHFKDASLALSASFTAAGSSQPSTSAGSGLSVAITASGARGAAAGVTGSYTVAIAASGYMSSGTATPVRWIRISGAWVQVP